MKKISSLFARDPSNPSVLTRDYHSAASWRDLKDLDCDKIKITAAAMGLRHRAGKRS